MPQEYHIANICHALQITYTELEQQPADWVDRMLEFAEQSARYQEHKSNKKE